MNEELETVDAIDLTDVLDDIPASGDVEEVANTTPAAPVEEQTNPEPEVAKPAEKSDEQKLLELLSSKIKYNGQSVQIGSMEDVVNTYQKGLNYDKVKSQVTEEKSNNAILEFINSKAKNMGVTPEEYIAKVKEFEEKQKEEQQEASVQAMIANGVDEATARRVARVEAYAETIKAREAELQKQEAERKAEESKNKSFEDFLRAYPDIDVNSIPAEVFEEAKNSNLTEAYRNYENKILKEKIKLMEQNAKNAATSVVKSVTDKGSVEEETEDPFMVGFDSV